MAKKFAEHNGLNLTQTNNDVHTNDTFETASFPYS